MLYSSQIHNYEDFRNRFGYKTSEKGDYLINKNRIRQRKNNIVYQYFKESFLNCRKQKLSLSQCWEEAIKLGSSEEVYKQMLDLIGSFVYSGEEYPEEVSLETSIPSFDIYEILNHGICLDGDINSIRYLNTKTNKIYKMKIGKYIGKFLDFIQKEIFWYNNSILKTFFIEEISEHWKNHRLSEQSMKIVVDNDFSKIYTRKYRTEENQDFRSCMDDKINWKYYSNHPEIYQAISLQDENGNIYARSILIKCLDSCDKEHILLERIYYNKRVYKDILFEKAKQLKLFDIYKDLNASCHEGTLISNISDDSYFDKTLHLNISFNNNDYLSYQDTFKYYYPSAKIVFNNLNDNLTKKYGNLVQLDCTETYYLKSWEND